MQVVGTSSSGFVYSDTGGDGPAVVLLHGVGAEERGERR